MALFESPTEDLEVLTASGNVQSVSLSGSGGRTRTYDPVVNSHLLCRLSYAGTLNPVAVKFKRSGKMCQGHFSNC